MRPGAVALALAGAGIVSLPLVAFLASSAGRSSTKELIMVLTNDRQLTPNFKLSEMLKSNVADAHRLKNLPTPEHEANLVLLAERLERVRAAVGKAVNVTSAYRSAAVNAKIRGASKTSRHLTGEAADIWVKGVSVPGLATAILDAGIPFDQLISYDDTTHLHIGIRVSGDERGELLRSVTTSKGKVYQPWDPRGNA